MKTTWLTRSVLTIGMACVLMTSVGCAVGPRVTEPMRAIWVTRFDYKTPDDVSRIIDNCADAGFNAVLFQVRGNGTVFYPSAIEPWAEQFDFQDPGFDPLALAIKEARERGVELHAWVNVMPAWRGPQEPDCPDQLYHTHPEWFWYDQDGNRQPLLHEVGDQRRGWYASVNPCLPEVREYLVRVFQELVANYEVDGLHMDYIRFPNERVVPGEQIPDYPRDERTLALYKDETGLMPDDDAEAWNQWRTAQVSKLVADIHAMMRHTRPRAVLSAAVGSVRERALHHFQDGQRWMDDGTLDMQLLMNYTDDPEEFASRIEPWVAGESSVPVVPGLWFGRHRDKSVEEATAAVQRQIEVARDMTGNFCIFAYSSLFDSVDEELVRQNERQKTLRQTRREILLPFLKSLAQEG